MKPLFLFCLLFILSCRSAQLQEHLLPNKAKVASAKQTPNSTYGKYFTPSGDLRALVIYVSFEQEFLDKNIHNNTPFWPIDKDFPIHNEQSVVNDHQELIWGFEHKEQFDQLDLTQLSTLENLSAYYYTMSSGQFRLYFETLKHPKTQKAISIKINPQGIPSTSAGRAELNKRVFQKIREIYPKNYNWSRFDNRINQPNYQVDNSTVDFSSTYADHQLDFVVLLFRNRNNWKPHPNGSENGVGWRKAIMGTGAGREIIGYDKDNMPIYVGNQGLRIFDTRPNLFISLELMIHEIAHGMISMPHINRANKAEGDYLFYPYGWGMMDTYSNQFATANAWERWYAGWTEITHDIAPIHGKVVVELDDYLKTDQSIRIQLPHQKDEFVWLEHRKDSSNIYYQRPLRKKDRYGKAFPNHQMGLYAFVEKMAPSRNATFGTNSKGTNGMKVIYGNGSYDYTVQGFKKRYYAWDNEVLQVQNEGPNAYAGQHEAMYFRHDFNKNGKIERKTGSNGAGSNYIDGQHIFEIDGQQGFPFFMFNTPIVLDKISAFTNPALTNFQKMDWRTNELAPVIMHSLSIAQQQLPNGNLQLTVDYEDGKIEEDFRMAGPIILPVGEVITLAQNKILLLNRSKTLNRVEAVDGSFIANSYLKIEGELIIEENATFIIEEQSKVFFEASSKLVMKKGAKIILQNEGELFMHDDAQIQMATDAKIVR